MRIFIGRGGCDECHSGETFSDHKFHNIGVPQVGDYVMRIDPGRAMGVNTVLAEIGAGDVPQVKVWNQIDRVPGLQPEVVRDSYGKILNIKVSAATGAGVDLLRNVLADAAREASGALASAA